MTALQLVFLGAVVAVLAVVWFRNRRTVRNRKADANGLARGVVGEAATAYEDVAGQFIDKSDDRPRRSNATRDAVDKTEGS
ncbi:hypothetical protein NHF48_001245 [Sphingomonas sp. H160509]|uniref:hypothetical protein n=1 Tax=Sphingomonas sp. H160509 TaxID=2955313 RepID=UPI0020981F4B|nr:hypothetical protein [Sphingomonas sp. H160509]MDD1449874.1 hypothetical protein [Sphingomonas sp. H160509]